MSETLEIKITNDGLTYRVEMSPDFLSEMHDMTAGDVETILDMIDAQMGFMWGQQETTEQ